MKFTKRVLISIGMALAFIGLAIIFYRIDNKPEPEPEAETDKEPIVNEAPAPEPEQKEESAESLKPELPINKTLTDGNIQ